MAAKQDKSQLPDQEAEVWNAIMAFEQILEAIPNDRTSIETLADAYEQIGDLTKTKHFTMRLAQVMIDEADNEGATGIIPKIKTYAEDDPAAKDILKKLENLTKQTPAPSPQPPHAPDGKRAGAAAPSTAPSPAPSVAGIRSSFNISSELSLAWNLLKSNDLSQEEYSSLVQDLTEMSSTDAAVTVSVLHVLNDRGFKNLSKIMVAVSKDCGTPIITLSSFDLQQSAYSLLSPDFMIRRGVLVFDFFGKDCLAVIMNPYDKQLMKDVETMTERKCHFFITMPQEFDAALTKINAALQDQGGSGKSQKQPAKA